MAREACRGTELAPIEREGKYGGQARNILTWDLRVVKIFMSRQCGFSFRIALNRLHHEGFNHRILNDPMSRKIRDYIPAAIRN